jgi:chorismate mutase/prephenate dehydratase
MPWWVSSKILRNAMDESTAPDTHDAHTQAAALSVLRSQIDAMDRRLLTLLNERAQLAQQVGKVKERAGSPVFRPDREASVIEGLKQANTGPLQADSIAPIWREIMSACRALETRVRVAFLGPVGTFSEQATLRYFGSSIDALPCVTIDDVFRAVDAGSVNFGVVPIENSTEGVVARSLDLLLQSPLTIVGETSLLVQHNLLRLNPALEGAQAVLGHPQALAQCQAWLTKHMPQAERRAVTSNAEGARQAAADATLAALASERAAAMYGLHVVQAAVQDEAHNRTRFVVISRTDSAPAIAPSGHDCTSVVVSIDNRPGAVHDMLMPLKQHGVSMTRLESRPARSGQWEYLFFIDLAGHASEPAMAQALHDLRAQCTFFKLLGSFPLDTH